MKTINCFNCFSLSLSLFPQNSIDLNERRIYNVLTSHKSAKLVANNLIGINQVLQGSYAFLMESSTLTYYTNRHCNLTQLVNILTGNGYGIAFPQNSPFRDTFSQAILHLYENNILDQLWQKWFIDRPTLERQESSINNDYFCANQQFKVNYNNNDANMLSFQSIAGIFVVLQLGIAVACLMAIIELFWKDSIDSNDHNQQNKINLSLFQPPKVAEIHFNQQTTLEIGDVPTDFHRETEI